MSALQLEPVLENLDLRTMLRYLGTPIRSLNYVFGNNKIVVDSRINPNGKTNERHIVLSFHRVRDSIAAGIFTYQFIDGKQEPEDALS